MVGRKGKPEAAPSGPPGPPRAAGPDPGLQRKVTRASFLLMAAALCLVLWQGLLPGLLSACVGFLLTRWLGRILQLRSWPGAARWAPVLAATLVIFAPLALLSGALSHSRSYITDAPQQYRELLNYLAFTVLELRSKLPPDIARQFPDGAQEIQRWLADYLATQAGALAHAGRAWLTGLLYAYVGLLIGCMAAVRPLAARRAPLVLALHARIAFLGQAFRQIVAAQFWISVFNTCLTAIFLLLVLPYWQWTLPYTPLLIGLTFVAGLVPIVGNLLCNAVITIVALSVSPTLAALCLAFLVLIHKAEYVINAKVVGQRTHMGVWELLAVMFAAESVFGPAGLVAAPLFYAYLKKELEAVHLV